MKKHKFLSACLGFAFLFNTTSCFCSNQGEKRVSQIQSNKKIDKEKIKKVITSKPAKVIGGVGAGLFGIRAIYEGIFQGFYHKNRNIFDSDITPYNITEEQVRSLNFEEKINLFNNWVDRTFVSERNIEYSCVAAIFYSIQDAVSFNNAKKMQKLNEERLLAFGRGICRNYGLMVSFWLDKLGIKNHMLILDVGNGMYHIMNIYYDEIDNEWHIGECDAYLSYSECREKKQLYDNLRARIDEINKQAKEPNEQVEKASNLCMQISKQSRELSGRARELLDQAGELSDQAGELSGRARELLDQAGELSDQAGELLDQAGELLDQAGELLDQAGELYGEDERFVFIETICSKLDINKTYVIESSERWGNKHQSDLRIMPLNDFLDYNGWNDNCENTETVGSKINLFKCLTKYYG